jgi:Nucleotide-diphospho-sugar transferase
MPTPPPSRRSSRRGSLQLPSAPKGARKVLRDAFHVRAVQLLVGGGSISAARALAAVAVLALLVVLRLALSEPARTGVGEDPVGGSRLMSHRASQSHVRARQQYAAEGGVSDLLVLLKDMVGPVQGMGAGGLGAGGTGGPNVTVVAVNYAYRELAMNFVCGLRRLALDDSYVILAMDRAVYTYASERGANVFYHSLNAKAAGGAAEDRDVPAGAPDEDSGVGDDADRGFKFGSPAFVRTSRRKSMLVAEVLALGYDVFFSDVDVVLFANPHPEFRRHAEDFVVMSDAHLYNRSQAPNYNINSGFYFVRARPRSFIAMRAIVKYGERSRRSEQKAFNHVLCGAFKDNTAGPGWRFGRNRCFYRVLGGVTTRVLSTRAFPNGSDDELYNLAPSLVDALLPEVVGLHVNYVSGRDEKVARIKAIGQWFYDSPSEAGSKDWCLLQPETGAMNVEPEGADRARIMSEVQQRYNEKIAPEEAPDADEVGDGIMNDGGTVDVERLLAHQQRREAQKQEQQKWREPRD